MNVLFGAVLIVSAENGGMVFANALECLGQ